MNRDEETHKSDTDSQKEESSNEHITGDTTDNTTHVVKSWLEVAKGSVSDNVEGEGDNEVKSNDDNDHDHVDGECSDSNDEKGGSWNGGQRPFCGAIQCYLELMRKKLNGCVGCLNKRNDFTYADVNVDPNAELSVKLDDGSTRKYKFHSVHYGPLKNREKRHWRSRDNIWERMKIYPPFRTLQVEMLGKGFYLMDESDPTKSKRMIIRLNREKPFEPLKLWHGYGVIPTLGAANPVYGNGVTIFSQGPVNFQPGMWGGNPAMLPAGIMIPPPGMIIAPGISQVDSSGQELSDSLKKMRDVVESSANAILAENDSEKND